MTSVRVDLGDRSYEIVIASKLLQDIGNQIGPLDLGRKCVIITDDKVGQLYANEVMSSLTDAGYAAGEIRLPQGEENKSLKSVERCYHTMLSLGLDRKSFIVALGGGLVGDLAGFVAATYMRGIPFIQVPTTLLADVDASIGGKTGANLREGKNLVGAFHQPKGVFIDVDTLKTLEKRDILSGFVELLKHTLIRDEWLYSFLKRNFELIFDIDRKITAESIARSCDIKARIVEEDEHEQGSRALLNFGHTVGHAIESLSIEKGKTYRHGEAVAIGMAIALDISTAVGGLKEEDKEDILSFLGECGLPTSCDFLDPEEVLDRMKSDKKIVEGKLRFVLLHAVGDSFIEEDLDREQLVKAVRSRCRRDG